MVVFDVGSWDVVKSRVSLVLILRYNAQCLCDIPSMFCRGLVISSIPPTLVSWVDESLREAVYLALRQLACNKI